MVGVKGGWCKCIGRKGGRPAAVKGGGGAARCGGGFKRDGALNAVGGGCSKNEQPSASTLYLPVNCYCYAACCAPNDVVQTILLAVITAVGLLMWRTARSRATTTNKLKIYEGFLVVFTIGEVQIPQAISIYLDTCVTTQQEKHRVPTAHL